MAVWKWFQQQKRSSELEALYDMLNNMWQEDRESCTSEQLTEYAEYTFRRRIEDDPQFQKFLQDLDRAFRERR
jgi:hypothetical protein